MNPKLKTAAHLERMILLELQRCTLCGSISAVTVRPAAKGWEIADVYGPGGVVPPACRAIAEEAADGLRRQYDLLTEDHLAPDYDLY